MNNSYIRFTGFEEEGNEDMNKEASGGNLGRPGCYAVYF
jgi:hypothetical protein